MPVLSFDTSCDETSVAVTNGLQILSNVISSQVRFHKKFGGVVPFLAQRLHTERIAALTDQAMMQAGCGWTEIDAIAVTYGPGLAPALEVGIAHAVNLAREHNKPLYPIDHMMGHIMSAWPAKVPMTDTTLYPALAILVSGGHTELVLLDSATKRTIIGQTLDDALGEAYDKVAIMLGLGYPGGKHVARLAELGNPDRYPLPVPMLKNPGLDISYSGLKTAVKYLVRDLQSTGDPIDAAMIQDICASFQRAAQQGLLRKIARALVQYPQVKTIFCAGGVAANRVFRAALRKTCEGLPCYFPRSMKLCGDNAAMIGFAAAADIAHGAQSFDTTEHLHRKPGLRVGDIAG
jgi:N6-L-threonylcarbamoyladenine synthase